jgi:hypothetical protein
MANAARDRLPASQQQDRQQRPLLRAAEHNRPFLLDHLERPQDAELKHDPWTPRATLLPRVHRPAKRRTGAAFYRSPTVSNRSSTGWRDGDLRSDHT